MLDIPEAGRITNSPSTTTFAETVIVVSTSGSNTHDSSAGIVKPSGMLWSPDTITWVCSSDEGKVVVEPTCSWTLVVAERVVVVVDGVSLQAPTNRTVTKTRRYLVGLARSPPFTARTFGEKPNEW